MRTERKSTHRPSTGRKLVGRVREAQAVEFSRRVRQVRDRLQMSQAEFATRFGLSLRSLQEWEQARRLPDMAALTYLHVIENAPGAVQKALRK